MAYIKVNHQQLENTAGVVEDYVKTLKNKMTSAQNEVNGLSSTWKGADYMAFKSRFNEVDDSDATHTKMVKALDSYAKYLRFAAGKYKKAQSDAVNRANLLPRW